MDAFVQAVESFVASGANPLTGALSLEAAKLTVGALETAVGEPEDHAAREAMALGSMMAGMALNTSRLGLVHGLAHPLGAVTGAPHGLLCGLLLPPVIRFNREAAAPKYARLAETLGIASAGTPSEAAVDALITFTESMLQRLEIPLRLRDVGYDEADAEWVAQETMPSGSTKANPRPVTLDDARAVLAASS
jgi:alcohol dehydrogenase class IV